MGIYGGNNGYNGSGERSPAISIKGKVKGLVVSNNTYVGSGKLLDAEGDFENFQAFENTHIDPNSFADSDKTSGWPTILIKKKALWGWLGAVSSAVVAGVILHLLGFY